MFGSLNIRNDAPGRLTKEIKKNRDIYVDGVSVEHSIIIVEMIKFTHSADNVTAKMLEHKTKRIPNFILI